VRSIAFPAISCGVYRYPPAAAVKIAVSECAAAVGSGALPAEIIFACFDEAMLNLYNAELANVGAAKGAE
jgi:O-acetyl-ADP-ribose deacetylase (regulator of RNase III)